MNPQVVSREHVIELNLILDEWSLKHYWVGF